MIQTTLILLLATTSAVHVRVDGDGFLRFARNGQLVFTNEADLMVKNHYVVATGGEVLMPQVKVPNEVTRLSVTMEGQIKAVSPNGLQDLGQIVLCLLPAGISHSGFFTASSKGRLSNPGDGLAGVIRTVNTTAEPLGMPHSAKLKSDLPKLLIEVQPKSELNREFIHLGDVAKISGPDDLKATAEEIDLGPTPVFGAQRGFSDGYLFPKILSAGLKREQFQIEIPTGAYCERAGQTVTAEAMVQSAVDAVREKYEFTGELKPFIPVPDARIPDGKVELIASVGPRSENSISVTVSVRSDRSEVATRTFSLVPADAQTAIHIGDRCTLTIISNGVTVEVSAEAKSAGWIGSNVTVQDKETLNLHTGKLIAAGKVEIRL